MDYLFLVVIEVRMRVKVNWILKKENAILVVIIAAIVLCTKNAKTKFGMANYKDLVKL